MRTLYLIAGVSDDISICTPSPLLRSLHSEVEKDLQKRGCPFSSGVTWQPLRELGMLLLPGDADALWFRAQEETGRWEEELESQHPCPYTDQASDVPRGHNCTLAWGSRTHFLLLLKAPF